jgi:hypothetical protein
MSYKCLTSDLGFPAGTILSGATFDTGTARQFLGWGLIEETEENPPSPATEAPATEAPVLTNPNPAELTDEELAKLTDPSNADD